MSKSKKNIIEVYDNSRLHKVITTFTNVKELLKYNEIHNLSADQIAINDCVLMGWDELYYFLK